MSLYHEVDLTAYGTHIRRITLRILLDLFNYRPGLGVVDQAKSSAVQNVLDELLDGPTEITLGQFLKTTK